MRRWTRGWKTFCLTLMVLTSFCMGVGVSQGLEAREVTAQLRPDFVIVIDQETAHFSDVNGSEVYPLLYEGTTYLPLRAIGNLMGKQVDWDEQSKTVTHCARASGWSAWWTATRWRCCGAAIWKKCG